MQEKGKDFFAMLAERDHTTVEKVKEKISKRIWAGLHDPDPERRAQWERIPCAGDVPTPEEWLRYSVERLKEDGREDLLRHYLIDEGCAFQRKRNTRYRYAGRKTAGMNTPCCVFPLFISAVLYEMLSL